MVSDVFVLSHFDFCYRVDSCIFILRDGAEQSGLFCALVNLLESVDTEDEISVTSVVRKILARRPNAIPTLVRQNIQTLSQTQNTYRSMQNQSPGTSYRDAIRLFGKRDICHCITARNWKTVTSLR